MDTTFLSHLHWNSHDYQIWSCQNFNPRIFPSLCFAVLPTFLGRLRSLENSAKSKGFGTLGFNCLWTFPEFFILIKVLCFSEAIFRPFSMATFLAESRIGLSTFAETVDIFIFGFQASSFCNGISSSSEASVNGKKW